MKIDSIYYHIPEKSFYRIVGIKRNHRTIVLAGPCLFLKDAYTTIGRKQVDRSYLEGRRMFEVETVNTDTTEKSRQILVNRYKCEVIEIVPGVPVVKGKEWCPYTSFNKVFKLLPLAKSPWSMDNYNNNINSWS
jgi:hypothetical protein